MFNERLHSIQTFIKGFFGGGTALGASYFSFMQEVEIALRIVSLLVGIGVGIITFISVYRGMTKTSRRKP